MKAHNINLVFKREEIATPEGKTFGFIERQSDLRPDRVVDQSKKAAQKDTTFMAITGLSAVAVVSYILFYLFS